MRNLAIYIINIAYTTQLSCSMHPLKRFNNYVILLILDVLITRRKQIYLVSCFSMLTSHIAILQEAVYDEESERLPSFWLKLWFVVTGNLRGSICFYVYGGFPM